MLCCDAVGNKAVPKEYRAIAGRLFSSEKKDAESAINNAMAFAKVLGISSDYARYLETYKNASDLETFLSSFQNNMDLLIQKTWVEKADENRKDDLQNRLPVFIKNIEKEDYRKALEEFGAILEELAYLFFGVQSRQNDFAEYAFRLDAEVGLFWWYGSMLCSEHGLEWAKTTDKSVLLAVLLLGICYLTNF